MGPSESQFAEVALHTINLEEPLLVKDAEATLKYNARKVFNGARLPVWMPVFGRDWTCYTALFGKGQVFCADLSEFWSPETMPAVFHNLVPKLVEVSSADILSLTFKGSKTSATKEELREYNLEQVFLAGEMPTKKQADFLEATHVSVLLLLMVTKNDSFAWEAERFLTSGGGEKLGRWRKASDLVTNPAVDLLKDALSGRLSVGPGGLLNACPVCGTPHEPGTPHNRDSPFYVNNFMGKHGRYPTWDDACSDCLPGVKSRFMRALKEGGVETAKPVVLH